MEQSPNTWKALEVGCLSCEAEEAQVKATIKGFVGLFLIQSHMEDYTEWFTTQIYCEPPMLKMLLNEPFTPHAMWLPELQRTIYLGIVYGQSNENHM